MYNSKHWAKEALKLWLPEKPIGSIEGNGVYQIVYDKQKKEWGVTFKSERFNTPDKLYGTISKKGDHIYSIYKNGDKTIAALFTGLKGSGKTQLAQYIANRAIDDGMAVILITEIEPNPELIKYLSNLKNVVLFLDEFGKVFKRNNQDLMLTMLSDITNTRKLILLTENNISMINSFMVNRPGRVRYHIKFNRLGDDVITDYCEDHNVDKEFTSKLLERYKSAMTFTFDHLQALIEEHLLNPEMSFDDLLELLNIDILNRKRSYKLLYAILDGFKYYGKTVNSVSKNFLMEGYSLSIRFDKKYKIEDTEEEEPILIDNLQPEANTVVSMRQFVSTDENGVDKFKNSIGMEIYLKEVEEDRLNIESPRTFPGMM